MKLYQIFYFRQVCINGCNISKAAEALHVSQPSVSNAINDLENEFGIALFSRINNRLVITTAGKHFLTRIDSLLDEINEIESEMKRLRDFEYPLRIGIPIMEFPSVYALIFDKFLERFPNIKIDFVETGDMLSLIKDSVIDIAILATNGLDLKPFKTHFIKETHLRLIVNHQHPLAQEKNVPKEILKGLPMVLLDHYKLREFLTQNDILPETIANTNQLSTMVHMVKTNKASTLLFEDILKGDDVRSISIEGIPATRIEMVWKKSNVQNNALKWFISFMIENTKET